MCKFQWTDSDRVLHYLQSRLLPQPVYCVLFEKEGVIGGNINTRRMSKPDMGSIFHIKDQYSGNRKLLYELLKLLMLGYWTNTDAYSCLQIPPRENWFQYVRRVYATAINFPCFITLDLENRCTGYTYNNTDNIIMVHL